MNDEIYEALDLPYPLRDYQKRGIGFLTERESALLADEMGLGKTVQVLVSLEIIRNKKDNARFLVVCPASLRVNWIKEADKWVPGMTSKRVIGDKKDRKYHYYLPLDLLVASYDQVRRDSLEHIVSGDEFDTVVLDEAQNIKNIESKSSFTCRVIPRKRSWALTGTPLQNSPSDIYSIFRFVDPGRIKKGMEKEKIKKRMRECYMRRKKEEVAKELPEINYHDVSLELTKKQKEQYNNLIRSRETEKSDLNKKIGIISELKQVCNYVEEGSSSKLELLQNILEDIKSNNKKIIIFSQYVETLKWLSERISIRNKVYHGGLEDEEKNEKVEAFRHGGSPQALLISLMAGGTGLNIPEADTVVLFDRWWNPAVEDQAINRAHRLGRDKPLHVFRFEITNTVEEKILDIVSKKRDMFEEYVEDVDDPDFNDPVKEKIAEIKPQPITT